MCDIMTDKELITVTIDRYTDLQRIKKCKCQYKNVGFIQNNYVGKPTFLFCIFSLRSSVRCCI